MSFFINAVSSAHGFYVGAYEVLGAAASFLWERVPQILPERLTQRLERIGPAIQKRTCQAVTGLVQRIRGRELPAVQNEEEPNDRDMMIPTLVANVYQMTIINVGRRITNWTIDETTSPLPTDLNPVLIFSNHFSERVARPLGRFSGTLATLGGICYLIGRVPEQNQFSVRTFAVITLLGLEYLQLNPISNSAEAVAEQAGYNFAFYSTMLLVNYLGMWAAGTPERLADYARKMTFSTLSYHASKVALEAYGVDSTYTNLTALAISSLAFTLAPTGQRDQNVD